MTEFTEVDRQVLRQFGISCDEIPPTSRQTLESRNRVLVAAAANWCRLAQEADRRAKRAEWRFQVWRATALLLGLVVAIRVIVAAMH